jgi:hypothetical protein
LLFKGIYSNSSTILEEKRKRRKMEQEQKTYPYSYDDQSKSTIANDVEEKPSEPEDPREDIHCSFQIPSDIEKVSKDG